MGLFSAKKKVMVSTVMYNMAGAIEDRVQYLPTAVVGAVISPNGGSLGETMTNSLLTGPGIKLRSFGRWSRTTGYTDYIGMTQSAITAGDSIDQIALAGQIPVLPGQTVSLQSAEISYAEYGYWADQWMLANHPTQVDADYTLDFDETTNIISVLFDGAVTYTFTPANFDYQSKYLYASYVIVEENQSGPVIPGSTVPVAGPGDFPSTVGWTNQGTTLTHRTATLVTTVDTLITYSDSRPNETSHTTSSASTSYDDSVTKYARSTFQGTNLAGNTWSLEETMYQYITGYVGTDVTVVTGTETIAGGVIKTTKTTTTTEVIKRNYAYKVDHFDLIIKKWTPLTVLIYKQFSGNPVLDAMFNPSTTAGEYFPFIPIRQSNTMVDDDYPDTELYARNVKAFKKATDSNYPKILTSVEANPSLGDIDYAFAEFGVCLNTQENAGRKYLYKYFQTVMGAGGAAEYGAWKTQFAASDAIQRSWLAWRDAQSTPTDPLYGTPEPVSQAYPAMPFREFRLTSTGMNYDMRLGWTSITETTGSGLAHPTAKSGDVFVEKGGKEVFSQLVHSKNVDYNRETEVELIIITWQDSPTTYRSLFIRGMVHGNFIYRGKGVTTSAHDALDDTDESGFIVPLHEAIFRQMSLKDATQLSTACCYMVFNCYQVVKQKWYQTSWFKVVIIIIAIVIAVVSAGSGAGASAGLLGTAASVGAALGFAGVVAIIVGTIANAIAAMILTQLIMAGSTALFGEKVGAIVGAIASFVAVAYGSGQFEGGAAAAMSNMGSAENLLKLSVAAGNGYAGYTQAGTKDIVAQTQELLDKYENASAEVSKMYEQNIGLFNAYVDPLQLTDSFNAPGYIPESSTSFLARTLMCGSDIAEATNSMLTDFVNMTLTQQLPA